MPEIVSADQWNNITRKVLCQAETNMRITNKIMTNNALYNINKNKERLSKIENQYTTGHQIQRPSEDPIIAVRALKLRTNLSELNQYYEKNIPDAKSWMNVTESSMNKVNELLTSIHTYCVQGANDTLTADERNSLVENLVQLKEQIYQEGNASYAGRYVFTGYKTDTPLIFPNMDSSKQYEITENLSGKSFDKITKVMGGYEITDYEKGTSVPSDFNEAPNTMEAHRIRLSYNNLDKENADGDTLIPTIKYSVMDEDGTITQEEIASDEIVSVLSTDDNAYNVSEGVHFIADTGELIFSNDYYEKLRTLDSLDVTYQKTNFQKNDLKPEHYFHCKTTDADGKEIVYEKQDQQMQFEISFNQMLTVNTQARDAIQHGIGREIEEIMKSVSDVAKTEKKITEAKKLLNNAANDQEKETLNAMIEQLKTELTLKNSVMQKAFENGMGEADSYQETVNVAVSDLGSRYVRLELTENRLSDQQVDYEDMLSTNEDADIVETVVRFNSMQAVYNAALSSAAKVVQNTLLDFL